MTVARIFPEAQDYPLGVVISAEPVRDRQTDDQRAGWHWLLEQWLDIDPSIAKSAEALKTAVLVAKFGAVKVTDKAGNEAYLPLRRTTQEWSWDIPGYKKKLLSRALYTELIDYTYQMAAEDGVVLPDLEPDVKLRKGKSCINE